MTIARNKLIDARRRRGNVQALPIDNLEDILTAQGSDDAMNRHASTVCSKSSASVNGMVRSSSVKDVGLEKQQSVQILMVRDKFKLAAIEVLECGNWHEADGDIAEAIYFCRYYALEMRRMAKGGVWAYAPGEYEHLSLSTARSQPRHCTLEFSFGDFDRHGGGLTKTGNTVVMKPAEQSFNHCL